MSFELARQIADAVLYEGYVLYPYRPSSVKNRFRWQFGIVAPRAWSEAGGEPWEMQTECLVEPDGAPAVDVVVRFLQVQPTETGWDNGVERTVELRGIPLTDARRVVPFDFDEGAVAGVVRVAAEPVERYFKLRVRVENLTEFPAAASADRAAAMRRSLAGAHTMLSVNGGAFLSAIDPPPAAAGAAGACKNLNTWPVLAGAKPARDVMLSAPIILEDYPAIAPESQGDYFDATEIDEILTLRVMTLTDEEKREACAADERARRVIERCDTMSPEAMGRLHGAIRSVTPVADVQFFNPPGEEPESQSVEVGDGRVSKGARVRLAPKRQADSMDFFLAGRIARVEGVHHDVDDRVYVAVTVEDDPGADLHASYGRYFYFYPDELELVGKEH